jgi:hypothetical protein
MPVLKPTTSNSNGSVLSASEPPAEKRRRRGGSMVRPGRFVSLLLTSLTLVAAFATAQTREGVRTDITVRGPVTAIDQKARTVTIREEQGHLVTVDVPPSATRFEQVKVGDIATISYYDRVTIRLKPAGEPAVDRTTTPTATQAASSAPGGTLASQRIVTVTLTGWDPANRVVSFNGPNGASYTRGLLDSTDANILSGLKVGEKVDVTWTVATRFSVQPK